MSESWEREQKTLHKLIKLKDHTIVSNVFQHKGKGGRPATIANKNKFLIENLTNTLINIKWGVEVVWCLLTPINATSKSKIQKIACASIYCKPGSKTKTDLYDHIAEAFNILSTKYQKGLHFIFAGDTNELNLAPILNLSSNLSQIVKTPTRIDPVNFVENMLDPVITTLASYYQKPQCLPPLDPDPDTNGKPSDHRIVLVRPISAINNECSRSTQDITVRPITEVGLINMRNWLVCQDWSQVFQSSSAHEKAKILQEILLHQFYEFFPEKTHRVSSDDQPWITHKLKLLDRQRKREYHKHRKSEKWHRLNKFFKTNVKCAKNNFYKKVLGELMNKHTSKWYTSLKKMTAHDQQKSDKVIIPDINHLSDLEQANILADHFSEIPNQYDQISKEDIKIAPIEEIYIPQFEPVQVWILLSQLNANKSTVKGDLPARIFKEFAAHIAEPLAHVINASLIQGEYPQIYKFEISTPVPKKYPTNMIRLVKKILK